MADSDATVLENLKTARDLVIDLIAAGDERVIEYEIRGRRVRRQATAANLKSLQELIGIYEKRVAAASGIAKVYARFTAR